MALKVKNKKTRKRDGRVKITSQNQISIPRQVMRDAGVKAGDVLQASIDAEGRIVLESVEGLVARFAGSAPGIMTQEELQRMRDEWDR